MRQTRRDEFVLNQRPFWLCQTRNMRYSRTALRRDVLVVDSGKFLVRLNGYFSLAETL